MSEMTTKPPCEHVWRWSCTDVKQSMGWDSPDAYLIDTLHCERCGQATTRTTGPVNRCDAYDTAERRNRTR